VYNIRPTKWVLAPSRYLSTAVRGGGLLGRYEPGSYLDCASNDGFDHPQRRFGANGRASGCPSRPARVLVVDDEVADARDLELALHALLITLYGQATKISGATTSGGSR
jgi:hypothetical protein